MRKLLRVNFLRLKKDKIFWLGLAAMAALGLYASWESRIGQPPVESSLFAHVPFTCIAAAIFTALFVGTDYADGTIRNKLIVGGTRHAAYLTNYAACVVASELFSLAYTVCYLALAIPLLAPRTTSMSVLVAHILLGVLLIAVWAALCTLVAMLWANRAYAVTACILLSLALILSGTSLESRLNEPEFLTDYLLFVDGEPVLSDPEPNPRYLTGTKRKVYQLLRDATPGGQVTEVIELEADNPILSAASDCVILLAVTACGLMLFKRKDLK